MVTRQDQRQGGLYYIIGASGAGKDSLIRSVCALAKADDRLRIAPRYITRPASDLDQHIELSRDEYAQQLEAGAFLFDWSAHGFSYAVSREVQDWVAAGYRVLIDGSRAYLSQAREIYPGLQVIGIEANSECLPRRLRQRGREDDAAISERLQRNAVYIAALDSVEYRIENNQDIEQAGRAMLSAIQGYD